MCAKFRSLITMTSKSKLLIILTLTTTFVNRVNSIVGGDPVEDVKDVPYQVSIRLKSLDGSFGAGYICSGALLDRKNVLTSAQCVHDSTGKLLPPESFSLVFRTLHRTKAPDQHLTRNVKRIYMRNDVNVTTQVNDVAVLRLDQAMPEGKTDIRQVEMRDNVVKGNTECRSTGWGATTDAGTYADVLQIVNLKVMGPKNCNASSIIIGRSLDPDHLCLVGARGKGACRGDLGGPLVCEKNKLTGIITFEKGCGVPGRHAIFTSVFSHKKWIESVLSMDNSAKINKMNVFVLCMISLLILLI